MKKIKQKTICVVSDSFVPYPISATGMTYNLCKKFNKEDYRVITIHGANKTMNENHNYSYEDIDAISTSFLAELRNMNNFMRLIFEVALSIILAIKCIYNYKKLKHIEFIIWYGPSSFLWLTVLVIKLISKVKVYYILRDIFPDWLISIKLIKNKYIIKTLEICSFPQYVVPDVIGVETEFNVEYLCAKLKKQIYKNKIETLYNWPSLTNTFTDDVESPTKSKFLNRVNKKSKSLKGVYIGNRSVAHDYCSSINFLKQHNFCSDLNIFGKNLDKNTHTSSKRNSFNEIFWGYILETELPSVLVGMDYGLVTLNSNLLTQNIPGKFVTYTQCGLPIMCFASNQSSLSNLIKKYNCGLVVDLTKPINYNVENVNNFIKNLKANKHYFQENSKKLFMENFNVNAVYRQILKSLA
jgi:hypothetical protein